MLRKPKVKRRVWTDEAREALIRDRYAHLDMPLNHWADTVPISDNWYRKMAEKYLATHPNFKALLKATAPASELAVPTPTPEPTTAQPAAPSIFATADRETKLKMALEYKTLPKLEKAAWREAHEISQANISNWIRRAYKAVKNTTPQPETGLVKHVTPDLLALVREYTSLPHTGGHKSAWLKAHNLTHQQIFGMKKRAKAHTNGFHTPTTVLPPTHQIPTIDDVIDTFEVRARIRNEVYQEFMGVLRSMRGGTQ